MSLTLSQIALRLKNREAEKVTRTKKTKRGEKKYQARRFKKRSSRRWLSKKEREGTIELCLALALHMREAVLRDEIKSLGGLAKPHRWPEKNAAKIRELRDKFNHTRRQLAGMSRERKEFYANKKTRGCYGADNAPHLAAKTLSVDVVVIYRILRKFARTGNVLFTSEIKVNLGKERIDSGIECHNDGTRPKRESALSTHAPTPNDSFAITRSLLKAPKRDLAPYFRDDIAESDFPPKHFYVPTKNARCVKFSLDTLPEYLAQRFNTQTNRVIEILAAYSENRKKDLFIATQVFLRLQIV